VFSAVVDHLQVQIIPTFTTEKSLEFTLGSRNGSPITEPPALGKTMDMSIHRKRRNPERLGHHDLSGLVPDSGQPLQGIQINGNLPTVLLEKNTGKTHDTCGLARCQAAWTDNGFDLISTQSGHTRRLISEVKKRWRDTIDAFIRALSGK
jgi:hypothetical protein